MLAAADPRLGGFPVRHIRDPESHRIVDDNETEDTVDDVVDNNFKYLAR